MKVYRAVFSAYNPDPYPFRVRADSLKELIDTIEMYLRDIYPMRKIVDGKLIKLRNSEAELLAAYEDNEDITKKVRALL